MQPLSFDRLLIRLGARKFSKAPTLSKAITFDVPSVLHKSTVNENDKTDTLTTAAAGTRKPRRKSGKLRLQSLDSVFSSSTVGGAAG